jgi:hypothetical protein
MVLFLIGLVISTAFQMISLGGYVFSTYALLSRGLSFALLPALIVIFTRYPRRFGAAIKIWTALAGIVGIWCMLQIAIPGVMTPFDRYYYFTLSKIVVTDTLHGRAEYSTARAMAGAWNSNVAGTILAMSLPVALAAVKRGRKAIVLLCLSMVLGGIVATGSRQAMIAVFLSLFYMCLPRLRSAASTIDVSVRLAISLLLVLVLIGVLVFFVTGFGQAQVDRLLQEGVVSGIQARWGGYQEFLNHLQEDPVAGFLGLGPNANEVGVRERSFDYAQGYVSNSWLLVLFEHGLLGLVGFLGVFIVCWRLAMQRWAKALLIAMAWLMMCDNAINSLVTVQMLVCAAMAFAVLAGNEYWEEQAECDTGCACDQETHLW